MNSNIYIETIRKTVEHSKYKDGFHFVGDSAYLAFQNGNRAKLSCMNTEIVVSVFNKFEGIVDKNHFPFANYFSDKQCSPGAPKWSQYIDNGKWYFSYMNHVLPNESDYMSMANGIDEYISLFE